MNLSTASRPYQFSWCTLKSLIDQLLITCPRLRDLQLQENLCDVTDGVRNGKHLYVAPGTSVVRQSYRSWGAQGELQRAGGTGLHPPCLSQNPASLPACLWLRAMGGEPGRRGLARMLLVHVETWGMLGCVFPLTSRHLELRSARQCACGGWGCVW